MPYSYRVEVTPSTQSVGESENLLFDTVQRDNLFALLERIREREIVPKEEAAEFFIGLKLFGEVMLRHRRRAPFDDLFPDFRDFMMRLRDDAEGR
ncbi:DUF3861 family protein [Sphingopyxis fribergensis]